jgi:hypothetical protein
VLTLEEISSYAHYRLVCDNHLRRSWMYLVGVRK